MEQDYTRLISQQKRKREKEKKSELKFLIYLNNNRYENFYIFYHHLKFCDIRKSC